MTTTPQTKADAYRDLLDSGEDVSLRRRVAAALHDSPATTSELADRFPDHSSNAIRPRVNELIRMGCVTRDGTRTNPSGHDAYIHELTDDGRAYLRGEVDPDPGDTVAQHAKDTVAVARRFVRGEADRAELVEQVAKHDATKQRFDPDFESPLMSDYTCIKCGKTRDLETDGEFVIRVGCPECEEVTTHQHVEQGLAEGPPDV